MTERGFKGVWIPREIWLHPGLTLQEKVLLVEIDSLDNDDGCFANNKHFSEFLNISQRRVQELIKSLKDKGYIEITFLRNPGENAVDNRVMRVVSSAYPQPEEAARNPAQGGAENRVPPTKKTAQGYAESRAPLYKDEKTILENQESITPLTPQEPGPDFIGFSPELAAKVQDWLRYKGERRENYKPMGLKSLLTTVRKQARQYGDEAVISLIDQCMAANYRGIIWDKLERGRPFGGNDRRETGRTFTEIAEMMDGGELF